MSAFIHILPYYRILALVLVLLLAFAHSLPPAARAVLELVVGLVAIKTCDEKRRAACLAVLNKLTRRDGGPRPRVLGPRRRIPPR